VARHALHNGAHLREAVCVYGLGKRGSDTIGWVRLGQTRWMKPMRASIRPLISNDAPVRA
jgi:hypothetical protein